VTRNRRQILIETSTWLSSGTARLGAGSRIEKERQ